VEQRAIAKAARMFRLPFVQVRSQSNGEMDYSTLHQLLATNRNPPAIINLNIGTTVKGAIDKIENVLEILEDLKIERFHIHLDAALSGMMLPFMKDAPQIDFTRYPIGSIAVSGHKFIGSPVPCGIAIARKHQVRSFEVEYLGTNDTTIMGSRNGLASVVMWEAIRQRQYTFADEVLECRENAEYLRQRIKEQGRFALLNPFSTTVVFDRPSDAVIQKWQLACYGDIAHVVVMQHHTRALLDQFLDEARMNLSAPKLVAA
jgi:histidine decarboxylase